MNKENIKKKEIKTLEKEIRALERQIKIGEYEGLKRFGIKSLKVTKKIATLMCPFVLCGSMMIGTSLLANDGLPFHVDLLKKYESRQTELNSNQPVSIMTSYDGLENRNCLMIYGPWTLNEEHVYERTVDYYSLAYEKITESDIVNIVSGKMTDFGSLLGQPIKMTQSNEDPEMSMEDASGAPNIQAFMTKEDRSHYIMVEETKENNTINTKVFLVGTGMLGCFVNFMLHCLKSKQPDPTPEELENQLIIKK